MKKMWRSVGSILLAGTLLFSAGCGILNKPDNTFTVTFVQDGCEDITLQVQAGASLVNIPQPQDKVGYTTGWDKSDFTNITSDITVTAISRPNDYTITYRHLDPMNNPMTVTDGTTQKVTYDAAYTLKTLECYGYTFNGWMNGVDLLAQSGTWTIPSNVTLKPNWSNNYYTITFIQEDGSSVDRIVENGDVLTDIPAINPIDGYNLSWSVTDFSTITENTSVTIVKEAKTYAVTYALDNGESVDGATSDSVVYGSPYQLKTPTKQGYNFVCWKLEDGTAITASGASWLYAQDVTLTAEWTESTNVVTFVHADGTTETRTVATGSTLTDIPTPKQTVEGYVVSWDRTNFSGISSAVTVGTVRTPKNYAVTYNLAAGESVDGEMTDTVTYDAAYALKAATKYGYTFVGWQTADGKVVPATGSAWKLANDAGIALTAKWQDNFYTVTFNNTDGTSTKIIVEKNGELAADRIPACKPQTGYNCAWPTVDFSSVTSDMTITAVKEAKTYTVRYTFKTSNESLPAGTAQEFTVTYGQQYQLVTPEYKNNEDMKFVAWKDASGKTVSLNDTWSIDSDDVIELVAYWKEVQENWTNNY